MKRLQERGGDSSIKLINGLPNNSYYDSPYFYLKSIIFYGY